MVTEKKEIERVYGYGTNSSDDKKIFHYLPECECNMEFKSPVNPTRREKKKTKDLAVFHEITHEIKDEVEDFIIKNKKSMKINEIKKSFPKLHVEILETVLEWMTTNVSINWIKEKTKELFRRH